MTRSSSEYEFARKIVKREEKNPNPWTANRKLAVQQRVAKEFGQKGLKEFQKEFRRELSK